MYNATTKQVLFTTIAIASFIITSCSESESTRNARDLYEQARTLNIAGKPVEAITILDSLQHAYPSETEIQRDAMKLRPTIIINAAEQRIVSIDDSIASLEQQYASMLSKMKRISDPRLVEPYYVDADTYNPDFMRTTGIQPRVSDIGQMYFVSSVNGENLKHTGFTLSSDGGSVTVGPVPYDGELNYRINGSEVVTYSPDSSEPAGLFAMNAHGNKATATLTGGKSKVINISPKQLQAIENCYQFSRAIIVARQLAFEKERLHKQIEIARAQSERLAVN